MTLRTVEGQGGVRLRVADEGEGEPVLLLHGFPDSHRLWDEVAPRLREAGHRTLAVDQRGFGDAEAPVGRARYGLGSTVADAIAVLDAAGADRPARVIGHDWGAVVGWTLASRHPERVASLVALSVGHPASYRSAGLEQRRRGFYTLVWQLPHVAEALLRARDFAWLREWLDDHPAAQRCVDELSRPGRLTAGLNWYRAAARLALSTDWPPVTVPTRGVWSTGDPHLTGDQMRDSRRRVDAPFDYVELAGPGHWFALTEPQATTELALEWFAATAG